MKTLLSDTTQTDNRTIGKKGEKAQLSDTRTIGRQGVKTLLSDTRTIGRQGVKTPSRVTAGQ